MTDWGVVAATIVGPVAAVLISRWNDRRLTAMDQRRQIYQTLLATRGRWTDPRHVEALNQIDLIYSGRGDKLREARDAWRAYLDHLEPRGMADAIWLPLRNEKFADLLVAMAKYFDLPTTRTELLTKALYPGEWSNAEMGQRAIRDGLAAIVTGKAVLPVELRPVAARGEVGQETPPPGAV